MKEGDSEWRKLFQSGVRRFKVEEEDSKWGKLFQSDDDDDALTACGSYSLFAFVHLCAVLG